MLGTCWKQIEGALKQISSGPFGIFGVNRKDFIYFREGISLNQYINNAVVSQNAIMNM